MTICFVSIVSENTWYRCYHCTHHLSAECGDEATYIGIGASNTAGDHTSYFDIGERALRIGVDVLTRAIIDCQG